MSSPRYAVFAPNMAGGGAERAALQLAIGLANRGFGSDLVLAAAVGPRMTDIPEHVNLVDLGASRVLSALPKLVRYLRETRPEAMVSVLDHANIVALWARRLAGWPPTLVVVEQNNLSEAAGHGKSRRDRAMPKLANLFYPWADQVACVSGGVMNDLRGHLKRVPSDRFRVIHNPIVSPDVIDQAREQPGHPWLEDHVPVFVAAGRLRPQKDFPMLIKAFAKMRADRSARLIILGEGPDRSELEELTAGLGLDADVDLYGHTANPYSFISRASAFVLSSRWEGLPTVLIEALACGVPVIATDCPSGPQEILDGGRYGLLVPVGDVDAMAAALTSAVDGMLKPPPEESWLPYATDSVVEAYLEVFAGGST